MGVRGAEDRPSECEEPDQGLLLSEGSEEGPYVVDEQVRRLESGEVASGGLG